MNFRRQNQSPKSLAEVIVISRNSPIIRKRVVKSRQYHSTSDHHESKAEV